MKREPWIDWAKVICLLFMTCRHSGECPDLLTRVLQPSNMPILLIVSGYLFKPKPVKKILFSFLTPIFCFSCVAFCIKATENGWSYAIDNSCFLQYKASQKNGLFTGIWFMWALLAIELLMDAKNCIRYIYFLAIVSVLYSLFIPYFPNWLNDLQVTRFFPCMPFFAFGYF